jgi:large subunit ribosomal protein L24
MKIHKGDTVKIISGKDRGKNGKVLKINRKKNLLIVEGLNLIKKHRRPKRQGEKGEIVTLSRPISISKVLIVCPSCNKPSRIGYRFVDIKKSRYCKKCKTNI